MIPLSYAQRRLWFLSKMEGASATYNMPHAIRLNGPLDSTALRTALGDVQTRHETLRTIITGVEEPQQIIVDSDQAELTWDIRTICRVELDDALQQAAQRPFDLTTEFPFRASLYQLGPDEHVLLIVLHHIIGDGWSIAPLASDLSEAYSARCKGATPSWDPLPVQYADYTLWQREMLGDVDDEESILARQLGYWTKQLAGLPEAVSLPFSRTRPPIATQRTAFVAISFDAELHRRLNAKARETGSSLFMVLNSGLVGLISLLAGDTDICVGAPIAGRTDEALDNLIGFFVNTLPLRTDVSGHPTFNQLIEQVRETTLSAYENQDVPFEYLVEAMNPSRSIAHSPLFQVILILQNEPEADFDIEGLQVETVTFPAKVGTSAYDLSISISEKYDDGEPCGMHGFMEYATDLFDHESLQDFAVKWKQLLEVGILTPDRPITTIDLFAASERQNHIIESGFNQQRSVMIPELLDQQVRASPDATAIDFGGATITYRELDMKANRLAHLLISRGVGPEGVVAIAMPRSPELVIGVVATLKAGAAFLPIDLYHPEKRVELMVKDARPTLLLQVSATGTGFGTLVDGTVTIDGANTVAELAGCPIDAPRDSDRLSPLQSQHPAFVIYTSGSTGTPKAIVTPHQGLANLIFSQQERLGTDASSRVLQFASPSFDLWFWETCMALLVGGTLVIAGRDELVPGTPLATAIVDKGITHATLPPLALDAIPAAVRLPAETTVILAGEAAPPHLVRRWSGRQRLVNVYGATECTICVTISTHRGAETGPLPIGGPVDGTRMFILGRGLKPVPVGVVGELYIGGLSVGRGYMNQPCLTAERFIACPYGPPGTRMYRTGDLVRRCSDDEVEFVGRSDVQVSIRGYRVEPAEVEAVLAQHPAVVQVATIPHADNVANYRLTAYIVTTNRGSEFESELRDFARARLPDYMVPATVVLLEKLPTTVNGKLDRRALPEPHFESSEAGAAPRTLQEQSLVEIFAEVLDLPAVGSEDNFFELGGHSMVAIKLIEKIRVILGVDLTLHALFQSPTPADLAGRLDTNDPDEMLNVIVPLRNRGSATPLFCFHPAGGLSWSYMGLLRHLDPAHPIYGVQARGIARNEPLPSSVSEMATDYVNEIRRVQPAGPYCLLGWSFGAVVAHAAATYLQGQGQVVALLVLLDGYPNWVPSEAPVDPEQSDVMNDLLWLFNCDLGEIDPWDLTPARAVEVLQRQQGLTATIDEERFVAMARVMGRSTALLREFNPGVFHGDAIVVAATRERPADMPSPEAWRAYVDGDVDIRYIDCSHTNMTSVDSLADIGRIVSERMDDQDPSVTDLNGG